MTNLELEWNDDKNRLLKESRDVCFEDVVIAVNHGRLLDIIKNASKDREGQFCLVINIGNYAYVVPFVKKENAFFLKTIYASRKYTKIYLKDKS